MWYYIYNGQMIGPISFEELTHHFQLGQITAETFVWKSGQIRQQAINVPELSDLFNQKSQLLTQPPVGRAPSPESLKTVKNVTDKLVDQIKDSIGVGQTEGFSLKELFSETFKKHTDDEMESYFGVGTPATTPDISQVNASWPKPWFFWRIVLFGLLGFYLLWLGFTRWDNSNCAPGAILFGSFAIPVASVMFFFECNILKNISLYQTIKLFLYGGIFGLIIALIGFDFMPFAEQLGAMQAGIVEEPAKLLVLILVLKMGGLTNRNYILNGLLCGAAVGAGFAAFESAGYAFSIFGRASLQAFGEYISRLMLGTDITTNPEALMFNTLVLRGILAPFGHIIWTGMSAAALWRVKGDQEFEVSMLFKPLFLFVFIIAIVLHMLWNSPWFYQFGIYPRSIALGFIGWIVIIGLMGAGLRQVRQKQLAGIQLEEELCSDEEQTAR